MAILRAGATRMPLGDESPASFAQLFLPQSRRCDATVGGGHIAQGLLLAMSDDVRFWPHCSLRPNARSWWRLLSPARRA